MANNEKNCTRIAGEQKLGTRKRNKWQKTNENEMKTKFLHFDRNVATCCLELHCFA